MARVTTSNYLADTDTQFAWATTDNDFFDREDDLYNLSQAVELHTHASGRGLAVERIADNAVTTGNLQALAVTTDKIAAGAVTTAKIADDAVTLAKLEQPMIQTANNMAGGYQQRETGNVYAMGFYMAGNGLAVIGAGPVGSVGSNIIMGQSNQVSIGAVQGAGKFNVMQTSDAAGGGARVYASNQTSFLEFVVLADNHISFRRENFGFMHVDPTFGYMTIGPTSLGTARLTLRQASDVVAEGLRWNYAADAASGNLWGMSDGSMVWNANGRILRLDHPNNSLGPDTDGAVNLGSATRKWGSANIGALTCTTINTQNSAINAGTGALAAGAATVSSLTVTGGNILPSVNQTNSLGTASFGFAGGYIGAAIFDLNGIFPLTHFGSGARNLGSSGQAWGTISCNAGEKTGGGDWAALSDDRAKMKTKFRPYDQGLPTVLTLDPVWYTYNGDYGTPRGAEYAGFRAQDLQETVPELVKTSKARRKPDEDEEDVLMVDTSNVQYMLINAIKELHTRLEALEARN